MKSTIWTHLLMEVRNIRLPIADDSVIIFNNMYQNIMFYYSLNNEIFHYALRIGIPICLKPDLFHREVFPKTATN